MDEALRMMEVARGNGKDPHGVAANTFDAPYWSSGECWMDWRTAQALERRGLVRIVEQTDVYLVESAA
jgi:hypothetical protein